MVVTYVGSTIVNLYFILFLKVSVLQYLQLSSYKNLLAELDEVLLLWSFCINSFIYNIFGTPLLSPLYPSTRPLVITI